MFLYTVIEAIVGVVAGILLAACTKKADGVTYGRLDKIGQATNILMIVLYGGISHLYLFLGMIAAFLGFVFSDVSRLWNPAARVVEQTVDGVTNELRVSMGF